MITSQISRFAWIRSLNSLLLVVTFLLSNMVSVAEASPNSLDVLEKKFADYFYSSNISSRHCGKNVGGFLRSLAAARLNPSEFTVLTLTTPGNPWSLGMLLAVNSRWGTPLAGNYFQNWDFHVVALHKSQYVFDFSFNATPKLILFRDYVKTMFIPINPFSPYGETFKVRGVGPYYTADIATENLHRLRIEVQSVHSDGTLSLPSSPYSLSDFLSR